MTLNSHESEDINEEMYTFPDGPGGSNPWPMLPESVPKAPDSPQHSLCTPLKDYLPPNNYEDEALENLEEIQIPGAGTQGSRQASRHSNVDKFEA